MATRLHVQKVHKVEYADIEHFSWKLEQFKDLLYTTDCSVIQQNEYSSNFEVPKSEYRQTISVLKNYDNLDGEEQEEIYHAVIQLMGIEYTSKPEKEVITELISILEEYFAAAEPDVDYLFFEFW